MSVCKFILIKHNLTTFILQQIDGSLPFYPVSMLKNIIGCMLTCFALSAWLQIYQNYSLCYMKRYNILDSLSVTDKCSKILSLYSPTYAEINHDPVCKMERSVTVLYFLNYLKAVWKFILARTYFENTLHIWMQSRKYFNFIKRLFF